MGFESLDEGYLYFWLLMDLLLLVLLVSNSWSPISPKRTLGRRWRLVGGGGSDGVVMVVVCGGGTVVRVVVVVVVVVPLGWWVSDGGWGSVMFFL